MKQAILFTFLIVLVLCLPAWGQTIRVTSPNGGSAWSIGSTYSITWARTGAMPNTVTIRLRVAGSSNSDPAALAIAASVDNSGSQGTFSWRIPETVQAGRYFVRVKTVGSPEGTPEVNGDSADFTIRAGVAQSLAVASPGASSSWRPGSRQTITWTKTGELNPMANLTLRREGAPETEAAAARIADGCANNGSRDWVIPESLAEGRYFVRVKSGSVQGDSAVFAISAGGRGSDLAGPDTPVRADLSMPGVGIEYSNGHVVAWVKNNGPESVREHDVTFRLHFPEREPAARIITKRITVPVGAEEGVQLLAMAASDIPDTGLRTIVSIDSALSHVVDANRLNQHRDVRIPADNRPPIDLGIRMTDSTVERVIGGGSSTHYKARSRGTIHMTRSGGGPTEFRRMNCRWELERRRRDGTTGWSHDYWDQSGTLQIGPFRDGQETTQAITIDSMIHHSLPEVYNFRIALILDPDGGVNDPNQGNNRTYTQAFGMD